MGKFWSKGFKVIFGFTISIILISIIPYAITKSVYFLMPLVNLLFPLFWCILYPDVIKPYSDDI